MKKSNKKVIGASIAGILTLTSVSAGLDLSTKVVVNAATKDEVNLQNKVNHLTSSLKKNYLGLKNVGQWQEYIKEARALNNKITDSKVKTNYTNIINKAECLVNAAARVNQVEKSMDKNAHVMRNVPQWNKYIDLANEDLAKVDKEFNKQINDLKSRIEASKKIISKIENNNEKDNVLLQKVIEGGETIDLATASMGLVPSNKSNFLRLTKKNDKTGEFEMVENYKRGDIIKSTGEYNLIVVSTFKTINFKVIDSSGKSSNTWAYAGSALEDLNPKKISEDEMIVKMVSKLSTTINQKIVYDGEKSNKNLRIEWTNSDIEKVTIQKDGESEKIYKQGEIVSEEGKYTAKAIYKSGKTTSTSFELDKTAPYITSKTHNLTDRKFEEWRDGTLNRNTSYKSIFTTEDVSFESDTKDIVKVATQSHYASYEMPYKLGDKITEEGSYSLRVYDDAENIAMLHFHIIKTPPKVTGVKNGDVIDLKDHPEGITIREEGIYTRFDVEKEGKAYKLTADNVKRYEKSIFTFLPHYGSVGESGELANLITLNEVGKYEFISSNLAGETKVSFEITDSSK